MEKPISILNQLSDKYEAVPAVARAYKNSGLGSGIGEENFGEVPP